MVRAAGAGGRVRALDGLRGVAAAVVLVHHAFLTDPVLAQVHRDATTAVGGWRAWVADTPLHLLWAGTEAVYVFFVLSGYVLALPSALDKPMSWWGYYPKRLVRLYLPVWGAVVLALLCAQLAARGGSVRTGSWFVDGLPQVTTVLPVLDDLSLLRQPGHTNSPLWSLKWEVVFSLLLPLFIAAARAARRIPLLPLLAVLVLPIVALGQDAGALTFLPMFGVGVVLAFRREEMTALVGRLEAAGRNGVALLWAAAATSLLGLTAYWVLFGLAPHPPQLLVHTSRAVEVLAAALLVGLLATWRPMQRTTEGTLAQWLGTRSFTLYLVHEPVTVTVTLLLTARGYGSLGWVTLLSLPLSLLVTAGFYRLVERPSLLLAGMVGTRARNLAEGLRLPLTASRTTSRPRHRQSSSPPAQQQVPAAVVLPASRHRSQSRSRSTVSS
jgi:peptidoglycan/LPS O-acetylase OafA/YrhL